MNKMKLKSRGVKNQKCVFFKKYLCFNKKRLHLQSLTITNTGEMSGALAQLVEQRTENPCVAGSIPAGTTT